MIADFAAFVEQVNKAGKGTRFHSKTDAEDEVGEVPVVMRHPLPQFLDP